MLRVSLPSALLLAAPLAAQGPVPYAVDASWESYPGGVTTGGAFADLDRDGDLDFVVANGNDILRQRVEVYSNDGAGHFPANPQWQSADVDYHGHLAVGDVNQDGWPDVAVSVFLGAGGFGSKGHVKLYLNNAGALGVTPAWRSADSFYSFSCDLGDADSDGDPDLAVATGEPYSNPPDRNRIYYNQGGALDASPGWLSGTVDHALDVSFGDADGDGDLDLAFCTAEGPNRIFYQGASGISTAAGWSSTDRNNQNGNSLAFGDVDADGRLDLAVADNDQLSGGQGVYKIYRNGAGGLATAPFWSDYRGYVSAVAFADLHLDGFTDLAGGVWWGRNGVYPNNAGAFGSSPGWQSSEDSVVEALSFGDLDGNGIQESTETLPGNGLRRTFLLAHAPIHELLEVRADGIVLGPDEFCFDSTDAWVALDRAPSSLVVQYRWSESLDMGVTNWDQTIGNLTFLRQPLVDVEAVPTGPTTLQRGDRLYMSVTTASTVNRSEGFSLDFAVQPASGGAARRIARLPRALAPFQTVAAPYSFRVPPSTPAGLNGSYYMLVSAVRGAAQVLDSEAFPFTLQ